MNTPLRTVPSRINPWIALIGWFAVCAATGAIGAIASVNAADFYATLAKPRWAPPAGLFGPVWTALYGLMAVAAWLVWRERSWARARGALGLFVFQLLLNASWSWLFFAWRRGGLAFADILVLLVFIVATIISFARVRQLAAWLLAPYLLWVCFAAVLNWTVWQQNPRLL